jgi:hypothetical protein
MLSPRCGCAVALRQVEKQHLVCIEVAGILPTTPNCHCISVKLRLCCSVLARIEVTSYACVVKKEVFSCSLKWCAFNFYVAVSFLPINLYNRSYYL